MHRVRVLVLVLCAATAGVLGSGCGASADPVCDLPDNWNSPTSANGDLCQVHIVSPTTHDVYCEGATGNWDCACGPLADNPDTFVSGDFCDLTPEERVCEAISRCAFAP